MKNEKFIDIDKLLREKAYKLYKWLPRFAINWLKKKLHEEDINKTMLLLKDDHGLEFNRKGLIELGAKVKSINSEFVSKTGSVVIVSNHPLGGLDGMALIKAVGDIRPDVRFLVNDVLKSIKNYGEIYVAVNKLGATSAKYLRVIEEVYREESVHDQIKIIVINSALCDLKHHDDCNYFFLFLSFN